MVSGGLGAGRNPPDSFSIALFRATRNVWGGVNPAAPTEARLSAALGFLAIVETDGHRPGVGGPGLVTLGVHADGPAAFLAGHNHFGHLVPADHFGVEQADGFDNGQLITDLNILAQGLATGPDFVVPGLEFLGSLGRVAHAVAIAAVAAVAVDLIVRMLTSAAAAATHLNREAEAVGGGECFFHGLGWFRDPLSGTP